MGTHSVLYLTRLIAYIFPSILCFALKTWPNPPEPISSMSSKSLLNLGKIDFAVILRFSISCQMEMILPLLFLITSDRTPESPKPPSSSSFSLPPSLNRDLSITDHPLWLYVRRDEAPLSSYKEEMAPTLNKY